MPNLCELHPEPLQDGEGRLLVFKHPPDPSGNGTKKLYFRTRDNRYEWEMTFFFSPIAIATVTAAK